MVRRTTAAAVATTATTTATPIVKKKRGRPSLVDLQNRALLLQQQQQQNHRTRSTRRIPNLPAHFLDGSDSDDYDHHDDHHVNSGPNSIDSNPSEDDDERAEKKIKLVVQFPHNHKNLSNAVVSQKHEKKNNNKIEKGLKATDKNQNGTRRVQGGMEHGPTNKNSTAITSTTGSSTGLPDKKLLLLILDKLQKKDTRGVFAEPVDPEELPDYHDIIEHPMDFETIRKKLMGGVYKLLEQLEDDVNLICSNAMQYNAPSTMFFRQARAIQDLAKKEFDILRQDGGLSDAPTKPRRGRPPGSKNMKKVRESSPPERIVTVHESHPEATPPLEEDPTKSGSYNLRKGPSLYRFPRSLDYCYDYPGFSPSSSKSMSFKYGKKTCGSDESRRDTYFIPHESDSTQEPYLLGTFGGFERQLTEQAGLALDHSYSRSLVRFAADLGPAVWKIVSEKITRVLPAGVEFGPGWVSDPKMSSTQSNYASQDSFQSEPFHPMTSVFPSASFPAKTPTSYAEYPQVFTSNVDRSSLKGGNDNGMVGPGSFLQIQHQNSVHPRMNGVSGSLPSDTKFSEAMARPKSLSSSSLFINPYAFDSASSFDAARNFHGTMSSESDLITQGQGLPYWQNFSALQASNSKGSNFPIGSPQLDLVL